MICYFQEDVEILKEIIRREEDFRIVESLDKTPREFGYTAYHFIVTLQQNRTGLIEYKPIENIRCEIQLKTIFDHAWSQVEHRFRYKSDEYRKMSEQQRQEVDKTFTAGSVNLDDAKTKFSTLRNLYKKLR